MSVIHLLQFYPRQLKSPASPSSNSFYILTLNDSNRIKPRPPIRDKLKQTLYCSQNPLIYFEAEI